MNKKQQQLFLSFFQQLYEAQESCSQLKSRLARCLGFNPALLFQYIINNGYNSDAHASLNDTYGIEIKQFRQFLSDKVTCNERELYELYEKFDWSRSGYISYQDWLKQILPAGYQSNIGAKQGTVTPQIQGHFLALINQYIRRFRILQVSRKQLHFIWPYNAFLQIDNFKTGFIGAGELLRFFQKNDYDLISPQKIQVLLHALKRRCYNQVNLQVFCQNLQPLQFGQYEAYKNKIQEQKQIQFLNRSRCEEQTMRRSRIQSWKIQHNIAKDQRRRRAQKQRQLQLQERINQQLQQNEKQKQRYIRRAMLEEDKNIRWNVEHGTQALEIQRQRQLSDRMRVQDLNIIRNQENDVQHALIKTALKNQDELQNSRRLRYNIERDRQIQQELMYKKELQRREYELQRQRRLEEEIQRERLQQRRQYEARQRALADQIERQRGNQKQKFISEVEASRRIYEQQLRLGKQRAQRQFEISRLRNQDYSSPYHEPASASRRVADLQRQLQRTRAEIRQRQSRVNSNYNTNKRQPETADRDYRESRA